MAEAPMCLRAQGVGDNNFGIGRVRRARGLSNDDGGIRRGRRIRDASEGLETTTETARARRKARGIYDNDGGVGRVIWARRLQQRQRRRRRRIDNAFKGSETKKEAAEYWRQAWWIGNENRVLISLAIDLLTVTLSCLCLVAVLFWYCFHQIIFLSFTARNTISTAIMRKYFCTKCTLTLRMYPLGTGE